MRVVAFFEHAKHPVAVDFCRATTAMVWGHTSSPCPWPTAARPMPGRLDPEYVANRQRRADHLPAGVLLRDRRGGAGAARPRWADAAMADLGPADTEGLPQRLAALLPGLPARMHADLLPLLLGNLAHVARLRADRTRTFDIEHREWMLCFGRGFDWLHTPNLGAHHRPLQSRPRRPDPDGVRHRSRQHAGRAHPRRRFSAADLGTLRAGRRRPRACGAEGAVPGAIPGRRGPAPRPRPGRAHDCAGRGVELGDTRDGDGGGRRRRPNPRAPGRREARCRDSKTRPVSPQAPVAPKSLRSSRRDTP
jgi:hypothetical protein